MKTRKNRKKRRMMRAAKRLIIIVVIMCSLVGIWNATYYWPDHKIKDQQIISEMEAKNSEDFKEIKAMFAEEIESRTKRNVEKVVFYVSAMDSYYNYTAEVYYKASGDWFTYKADEFSRRIDTELENKLINLLIG